MERKREKERERVSQSVSQSVKHRGGGGEVNLIRDTGSGGWVGVGEMADGKRFTKRPQVMVCSRSEHKQPVSGEGGLSQW